MADIKLLFGIAGDDSITEEGSSGKLISDTLGGIIAKINKDPLEIKFQADEASVETFRSKIKEITSSLGSEGFKLEVGGLREMSESVKKIADLFDSEIGGSLSNVGAQIEEIRASSKTVSDNFHRLLTGIGNIAISTKNGFSGLTDEVHVLRGELESVYETLNKINSKEFNVSNFYDTGGSDIDQRLELERDRANELLRIYTEVRKQIDNLYRTNQPAHDATLSDPFIRSMYHNTLSKDLDIFNTRNSIAGGTSIEQLRKISADIENRYILFKQIIDKSRDFGADMPEIDVSGLERIASAIEEYNIHSQRVEEAMLDRADAEAGIMQPFDNTVTDEAVNGLQRIKELYAEVDDLLTKLRDKIESTFDLTTLTLDTSRIREVVTQIQEEFDNLEISVRANAVSDGNSDNSTRRRRSGGSGNGPGGNGPGGGGDEDDAITVATTRQALDTYREMHRLLNSNRNFSSTEAFRRLNEQVDLFSQFLPSSAVDAVDDIDDLGDEFEEVARGIQLSNQEAVELIDNARLITSEFRAEMEASGQSGVSLKRVYDTISSATNLLGRNNDAQGTDAYNAVERRLNHLREVVRRFESGEVDSLEEAFRSAGLTGSRVIDEMTTSMSRLRSETANATTEGGQVSTVSAVKLLAQSEELLTKNMRAGSLESYGRLIDVVAELKEGIDAARDADGNLDDSIDTLSVEAIERARLAIAELREEMQSTGLKGNPTAPKTNTGASKSAPKVALSAAENTIARAKKLISANDLAKDLPEYKALESILENLVTTVDDAKSSAQGLNGVLNSIEGDKVVNEVKAVNNAIASLNRVMAEKNISGGLLSGTDLESYTQRIERLKQRLERDKINYSAAQVGKYSKQYGTIGSSISKLDALLLKLGTLSKDQADEIFEDIETGALRAENAIKNSDKATKSWSDRFGSLTKKITEWFGAAQLISAIWRALQRMVTSVIELDTAMTELKKVTNETDATYEKFLVNAANRAKQLGATLTDTVTATADFARLGYDISEAEKMADAAIIYKNVGDGIQDINQASESIIATMQAFGVEADDVMTIVDRFNTIGRILPIYTVMC